MSELGQAVGGIWPYVVVTAFAAAVVAAWLYAGRARVDEVAADEVFSRPESTDDVAWAQLLAEKCQLQLVDLREVELDDDLLDLLPSSVALKYRVFPISRSGADLVLAMANPGNVLAVDDVKFMTGYNVRPVVAPESQLEDLLSLVYPSSGTLFEPWVPKVPKERSGTSEKSRASELKAHLDRSS